MGRVAPTLTTHELNTVEYTMRIRKLTPRECLRLMDVTDEDITRMMISDHTKANEYIKQNGWRLDESEQTMSNTQLYKQAGNSIVVSCLVALFSQLNIQGIKTWNDGLGEEMYGAFEHNSRYLSLAAIMKGEPNGNIQ